MNNIMSQDLRINAVIQYLNERGYVFLQSLGKGTFGTVIAVRTPSGQQVAVKIINFEKIWYVEDQHWPLLRHPHILPVENILAIHELRVKLYFMPILTSSLDHILRSEKFRKDPKSFNRVKKWFLQILSALEYLHSQGLSHLDLKTDNILIDQDDNAVLADFSGLNFTLFPINRFCSPLMYRPPEYFRPEGIKNIQGESFDLWTYSLLVLNVLTRDYFYLKARFIHKDRLNWCNDLKPILNKALKESKFRRLLKKTFPKCSFSTNSIHEILHFVKFLMNFDPVKRPSAIRAKRHPFLKRISNPFLEDLSVCLQRLDDVNPFRNKFHVDKKCEDCSRKEKKTNLSAENQNGNPGKHNWFMKKINRIFK